MIDWIKKRRSPSRFGDARLGGANHFGDEAADLQAEIFDVRGES
jgi:hypothetical protein